MRIGNCGAGLALALWVAAMVSPAAQSAKPPAGADDSSCWIETTERIVAVGDVHGAYDRFVAILRQAGLIDARQRWSGGRAILVQTGDVLDRGPDSRRVLDLLRRLEGEAVRAGGRVYALLGNHEVMRIVGDWRYVSAGEVAGFRALDSEELRERYYGVLVPRAEAAAKTAAVTFDEPAFRKRFLDATPLGSVEMQIAFGPRETYGRWVRDRLAMVRINGIVFLHGGISPAVAAMGCAAVNATVRTELAMASPATDPQEQQKMLIGREDGPLWYRGLAEAQAPVSGADVGAILQNLDARAIVIGHTVTPGSRIHARFDGRVVQIDTGMLGGTFYPDGRASALEIRGNTLTAIYEDRRDVLTGTAPPLPPSPQPASAPAPQSRPGASAAP